MKAGARRLARRVVSQPLDCPSEWLESRLWQTSFSLEDIKFDNIGFEYSLARALSGPKQHLAAKRRYKEGVYKLGSDN